MTMCMLGCIWIMAGYCGSISMILNIENNLSFMMIFLTLLLYSSYFLFLYKENKNYNYLISIYLPMLVLFFSLNNLFLFYIMFELSILPIYIMIMGWGNQPERLLASNYLLMYTLFFSFPLLSIIIYLMIYYNNFWTYYLLTNNMIWLLMMMPFFVKIPIYLFHLWLPKAHVEAPVIGSMILASILLKTGGYGLMKMSFLCNNQLSTNLNWTCLLLVLSSSTLCMLQTDLKKYIAYSSVTHMSMIAVLMFTDYTNMLCGVIILMISHGVISNSLFYMVGLYSWNSLSRVLYYQSNIMLSCSMLWFISMFILFLNNGMPPSINMLNEIMMYLNSTSLWFWNILILWVIFMMMMYYPVWFMSNMNSSNMYITSNYYMNILDYMLLLFLPFMTLLLWANSNIMM
uniref:NADH-ubiquinone oxidoreductase chain 4 n=1 Tax=Trichuris muris TaxID=70415 RepID=A0A0S3M4A4_TRIMR|nr:NADH dehydrogenase subunit 4 [Trichuris muris]BAT21242.1 NADH dehydrogenase subunit 4 [Trichuris muris]